MTSTRWAAERSKNCFTSADEDFQFEPRVLRRSLIDNGYQELAITGEHATAVDVLAAIHKDPFDRMLVAQSIIEGITLLTADAMVARYPGPVRLV
jgi:PIN domain nuclease of toxin-antitoxin system